MSRGQQCAAVGRVAHEMSVLTALTFAERARDLLDLVTMSSLIALDVSGVD